MGAASVSIKLIGRGLQDLGHNPWAQLLTLAAVTLVTFLSGLLLLVFFTVNQELQITRGEVVYQVYWKPAADMKLVQSRWDEMKHLPHLKEVQTYTPEQALRALAGGQARLRTGQTDQSRWMKNNPLPPTAILHFAPQSADIAKWQQETRTYLEKLPGVEQVKGTPLKDDLAKAWRAIANLVMWPAIAFLGLILSLVVGNTIKLSLISRQDEIDILQLVGARNWYIRLPLLIGGGAQGLLGGLAGTALLYGAWLFLHDVLNFPPLFLQLEFLPLYLAGALALTPALMGVISSWAVVR